MKVIGITGGVGSGKSQVLQYLQEEKGAVVCQLDEVAKELQRSGQPCFEKIVELFGTGIVGVDGELDREKLAQIVFSDAEKLNRLNEIVHPEVKKETVRRIAMLEHAPLFMIEAALLPAAGYEDICDEMWYIYTDEQVRRRRLKASRGYSEEKITHMIESQPDEEQFRKACTAVIDNSGSFENTKSQIGELL